MAGGKMEICSMNMSKLNLLVKVDRVFQLLGEVKRYARELEMVASLTSKFSGE